MQRPNDVYALVCRGRILDAVAEQHALRGRPVKVPDIHPAFPGWTTSRLARTLTAVAALGADELGRRLVCTDSSYGSRSWMVTQ